MAGKDIILENTYNKGFIRVIHANFEFLLSNANVACSPLRYRTKNVQQTL